MKVYQPTISKAESERIEQVETVRSSYLVASVAPRDRQLTARRVFGERLFRRDSVELRFIRFGFEFRRADDAVLVMRRRIDRVHPQ